MAEQGLLQARLRDRTGTPASRRLRREGRVPVVVYGAGLVPRHLWVVHKDLQKEIALGQRIFSLKVEDGDEIMTVIKEVQMDIYQEAIIHADFLKVEANIEIDVHVNVELRGTPAGEKDGGRIDQPIRKLTVQCLPSDIPDRLTLDVSALKIGDTLSVADIPLPPGIKVKEEGGLVVCSVQPPKGEETVAPVEGEEVKEPELIGREKKEDEEEEGEEEKK